MSRIECYLKCRSQVVYLDGIVSSRCDVLLGGPQCSVLGHLLFLLYNNDLFRRVFLLIIVFWLPMMSYCWVISGQTTKFKKRLVANCNSGVNCGISLLTIKKCSVLSINDDTIRQPYYLYNSRLQNIIIIKSSAPTLDYWKAAATTNWLYLNDILQLACCVGTSACGLCCKCCPSCKNSTSSRIVYALFLLLGVSISCILLIPGVRDGLEKVSTSMLSKFWSWRIEFYDEFLLLFWWT